MAKTIVRLILPALLLVLPGCRGGDADPTADLDDVNVLLIVIDTLGAEHLGSFTPGLDCSPRIDQLADGGVLFEKAYAAAPWTQPSMAALVTGLFPSDVGVTGLGAPLPAQAHTLAEAMSAAGRTSYGVVSHFLVGRQFGWAQGFASLDESAVGDHAAISSPRVTDVALDMLRKHVSAAEAPPFFLLAHYFDPHFDYLHHPEFDRTSGYDGPLRPGLGIGELRAIRHGLAAPDIDYLVGLYREEIAFTDHHVGRLLDGLTELGLRENTLVILTADHGEEFMRHGWIGHTLTLYDELIHVPLIWSLPGRLMPGRVATPVSLVDVMPTLEAWVPLPPSAADTAMAGISLLPLLTDGLATPSGDAAVRDLFAEVSFVASDNWPSGDSERHTAFKTALMSGRWKVVHDVLSRSWQAFDRETDPDEMHDLFPSRGAELGTLQERLSAWEEGRHAAWGLEAETGPELDDRTRERLKSLGYVH